MVKATAILHCTVEEFTVKPPVPTMVNAWCKSSCHLKCVQKRSMQAHYIGGCQGTNNTCIVCHLRCNETSIINGYTGRPRFTWYLIAQFCFNVTWKFTTLLEFMQ
jgi:hypothetical protein